MLKLRNVQRISDENSEPLTRLAEARRHFNCLLLEHDPNSTHFAQLQDDKAVYGQMKNIVAVATEHAYRVNPAITDSGPLDLTASSVVTSYN